VTLLNFDDHAIDGYMPTVGRVRHLTDCPAEPARGVKVEYLCGGQFTVGTVAKRQQYPLYDCTFCFQVWREHPNRPLAVPAQPSRDRQRDAATAPIRGGQGHNPVGADDPEFSAPTGRRFEEHVDAPR
jgi:hypothetical protein